MSAQDTTPAAQELPMFPLGSVLLPGMVLPLHVFEPRYRVLVDTVLLSDDQEFGVVLIERGSEVGGGETRSDLGCVARIVEVERSDDGRSMVVAVGTRRIRVDEWLPDDPFPRARVSHWPDPPPTDEESVEIARSTESAQEALGRVEQIAQTLGVELPPERPVLSEDPALRVFQLATLSPLGALDRSRILAAASLAERARLLVELVEEQEILLEARRRFGTDPDGDADDGGAPGEPGGREHP